MGKDVILTSNFARFVKHFPVFNFESGFFLNCPNFSEAELMKIPVKTIVYTAMMTAMTYVVTILGINMGPMYFNVGDFVIFMTGAMFGPFPAMIAGGLGSFFADLTVYPSTMIFTLFIKGIEGLVCGLIMMGVKKIVLKNVKVDRVLKFVLTLFAFFVSGMFMTLGYFLCNWLFYGTYQAAVAEIPVSFVQNSSSTFIAMIALYSFNLAKMGVKLQVRKKKNNNVEVQSVNSFETENMANSSDAKVLTADNCLSSEKDNINKIVS